MKQKRYKEDIEADINGCRQILKQLDYKSHKHADGVMDDEEWSPIAEQRQSLRDKINAYEAELETAPSREHGEQS